MKNTLPIAQIKSDFPTLSAHPDLIYLDSAATSLTPEPVLAAMDDYYRIYRATVSRGVYALSEQATREYESVRTRIARFLSAPEEQIVFTTGTTMGLNMVAHGLRHTLTPDSEIIATLLDHHANFVPWQRLVSRDKFHVAQMNDDYTLDTNHLLSLVGEYTHIVALPLVSNVTGAVTDVTDLIKKIKEKAPNAYVIVDAAQAVTHMTLTPETYDCDFLAFSGHKMFGPTGTGILWGTADGLARLDPLLAGGDMIAEVTTDETTYRPVPYRLEAGTPNIAGIIGLGAACDYLSTYTPEHVHAHTTLLATALRDRLQEVYGDDITLYTPPVENMSGIVSFSLSGTHPHDIAATLDTEAHICVRAGNHCAGPLHSDGLHVPATVRASFSIYNTLHDIEVFLAALDKAVTLYKKP